MSDDSDDTSTRAVVSDHRSGVMQVTLSASASPSPSPSHSKSHRTPSLTISMHKSDSEPYHSTTPESHHRSLEPDSLDAQSFPADSFRRSFSQASTLNDSNDIPAHIRAQHAEQGDHADAASDERGEDDACLPKAPEYTPYTPSHTTYLLPLPPALPNPTSSHSSHSRSPSYVSSSSRYIIGPFPTPHQPADPLSALLEVAEGLAEFQRGPESSPYFGEVLGGNGGAEKEQRRAKRRHNDTKPVSGVGCDEVEVGQKRSRAGTGVYWNRPASIPQASRRVLSPEPDDPYPDSTSSHSPLRSHCDHPGPGVPFAALRAGQQLPDSQCMLEWRQRAETASEVEGGVVDFGSLGHPFVPRRMSGVAGEQERLIFAAREAYGEMTARQAAMVRPQSGGGASAGLSMGFGFGTRGMLSAGRGETPDSPAGSSGDSPSRPTANAARRRVDDNQLAVLLQAFGRSAYPSTGEREALGRRLGMTSRSVQIWFQNRRRAVKVERESAIQKAQLDAAATAVGLGSVASSVPGGLGLSLGTVLPPVRATRQGAQVVSAGRGPSLSSEGSDDGSLRLKLEE